MFDGIFEAISNTIRSILFGPLAAVLGWIINIVDIILSEISGFSFIDMEFIATCYTTCVTIALVILPLKLTYEWIWLVITNEVEKWTAKVFAVFQIIVILVATPAVLTQVGESVTQINNAILAGDVVSGQSSATGEDAGKGFASTMLVATTGMTSEEATAFMEDFTSNNFDINKKDENDNYVYSFDFIMPLLVGIVMWIIIFFIGLQMASRQVSLAFFKIITPLCALSLTNKDSPTAFTVWKNNIIGPFLMNMVQIFLFLFMFKLIDGLGTETSGLAKLLFTIALLLVIIAIPNKISAMIGGYNSGIMEGLAGMQQTLMMASSGLTTAHMVNSGVRSAAHAVKGGVGALANAPKNIAKMAGTATSKAGGASDSIKKSASQVKEAMKYGGGVGGAASILGSGAYQSAKSKIKDGAGGVGQSFKRSKRESDLKSAFGQKSPHINSRKSIGGVDSKEISPSSKGTMTDGKEMSKMADGIGEKKFEKIQTTGQMNKKRANKERRFK